MIKAYAANSVPEIPVRVRKKQNDWEYVNSSDQGKATFERCIENPWVADKLSQIQDIHGKTLFDFGCNRAKYVIDLKNQFQLRTYGIDAKAEGREYVDRFFHGVYNNRLANSIKESGPYHVATAISAVEHAGHDMHPNAEAITAYQYKICVDMMSCSNYFFLTVPFGRRPGWAKDKSRTNLYQFDTCLLDSLKAEALRQSKDYLEEIYMLREGLWVQSNRDEAGSARYRGNKLGASAIALISFWG